MRAERGKSRPDTFVCVCLCRGDIAAAVRPFLVGRVEAGVIFKGLSRVACFDSSISSKQLYFPPCSLTV